MPIRNAGFPRSTRAVGCGAAARPRTANTDTNTFGAYVPRNGTSTTGDLPDRDVTKASMTPSRSTVTSAVDLRNGARTWTTAVSPGS